MILESGHTYHGVPKERQSYQMLFIENVNADVETQFFEVVLTLNVHCSCTILDPSVYVYPIFKCTVSKSLTVDDFLRVDSINLQLFLKQYCTTM